MKPDPRNNCFGAIYSIYSAVLAVLLPLGAQAQTPPVLTQIPPHNSITAFTPHTFSITTNPTTYSVSSPTLLIDFTITPGASHQTPPYVNELIELSSNTGAIISLDPQTDCARNGTVLSCNAVYTLPPADLALPVAIIKVRYYVDRNIPNTSIYWNGYGQGSQTVSLSTTSTQNSQTCNLESDPMLPTQSGQGNFTFTIPAGDVCPSEFWIDPPIAAGYDYAVSGALVQSITMPNLQTVNDPSGYVLETQPASYGAGIFLNAGETYTFVSPVSGFAIRGINPDLGLDPNDGAAFALGIDLTAPTGTVTLTQTAMVLEVPGAGPQPAGCVAWTQSALLNSIKAQLPTTPDGTYNLRVILDTQMQQALLTDLAKVRAWRPDTREINIKTHATYAGDGADPNPSITFDTNNPEHPDVDTLTSIFESPTRYMTMDTWTGGAFQTDHWYRVDSKVNVMDYDYDWISPWADECLYQTAFVRVDATGAIALRIFDDLSGANGSPL